MPQFIDLSHAVEHGMETYRGLPAPQITDFLTREASRSHYGGGTEFVIASIQMVANTGTYVDAPFHRYPDGGDLADLPLESLANLEIVLIRWTDRAIPAEALAGRDVAGKAVLFHTGWDRHWRQEEYFSGRHPFVARGAAQALVEAGARFVGIDSYNIDDTEDGARPAHSLLLAAGIPVCEHMCNLGALPASPSRLFAVPVKVRRFGSFPVRAFAIAD